MTEKFTDPEHFMALAADHLKRVQSAWDPPDWSALSTYGLYCLEALVRAALLKFKYKPSTSHWQKAQEAEMLHGKHGLPDISDLMSQLNSARKASAYGDSEFDEEEYDAEDIATSIEEYFDNVRTLLNR